MIWAGLHRETLDERRLGYMSSDFGDLWIRPPLPKKTVTPSFLVSNVWMNKKFLVQTAIRGEKGSQYLETQGGGEIVLSCQTHIWKCHLSVLASITNRTFLSNQSYFNSLPNVLWKGCVPCMHELLSISLQRPIWGCQTAWAEKLK